MTLCVQNVAEYLDTYESGCMLLGRYLVVSRFSSAAHIYFCYTCIIHPDCNFKYYLTKCDLKYFHQHPHLILLPTVSPYCLIILDIVWLNNDFQYKL